MKVQVISSIVHLLKSSGRWAHAPRVYKPRKTLYNRWVRWAKAGVCLRACEEVAAAGGPPVDLMLDPTLAKAHRCAASAKGAPVPTP